MPWHNFQRPVVAIIGPTAVGKTAMAVELAKKFNGEIVSADSRQFYRGMDIGTAKPTPEELARVPHHLIDVSDPDEPWSLAAFKREAQAALAEIHNRGKLPFLVGGTGQYIYGLLDDWQIPNQQPNTHLRQVLEAWGRSLGPYPFHHKLALIDPKAAAVIQPENLRRTVRALEVILLTGHRFSEQRQVGASPYSLLKIGLIRPRAELYARVDARIAAMLADGLVEEVRQLRENGFTADLPTLSAIGYREICAYLDGKISLNEAVILMKRLTRDYIRRQANWFKQNDPTIHWLEAGPDATAQASQLIERPELWTIPQNQTE
ncbi:tRNA (adenosine(37)-N6)-dimethylallyltransferase MiaA [bacterium]|nr:tRNA (adenosine(37)-N6)-dimethylallyltransferase MiaA [bacterium]